MNIDSCTECSRMLEPDHSLQRPPSSLAFRIFNHGQPICVKHLQASTEAIAIPFAPFLMGAHPPSRGSR